jgi:hypothetical protein
MDPPSDGPPLRHRRPTVRGVIAIVALFAVTLVAAQTCQRSQVRLTKERAIELARPHAGFAPERTQVRLVRQGIDGRPSWAVSFSVPAASGDGYDKLTTVRVNANSGKIEAVNQERP